MRSSVPWLTSLILHSSFLFGIVVLSQTPAKFSQQLSIDFQLAPNMVAQVEEVAAAPPVVPPPPVKEIPRPVEKKTPPPPVPEIKKIEPAAMIEPAPAEEIVAEEIPQKEPVVAAQPEPEVVPVIEPAPVTEPVPVIPPVSVVDPLVVAKAAEEALYIQTVGIVRGQVLKKMTYPAIARKMGWCGKLVLGFTLCADGSVEELEVLESSGHKVLDRAAIKAVIANAPFRGNFARTKVKLPVNFQLN